MALIDDIPDDSDIAFDTDAVIYYVEEHPQLLKVVEAVVEKAAEASITLHVSLVTLTEVLVLPLRNGNQGLIDHYRDVLTNDHGFVHHVVTPAVAERAAQIRALEPSNARCHDCCDGH